MDSPGHFKKSPETGQRRGAVLVIENRVHVGDGLTSASFACAWTPQPFIGGGHE